MQNLSSPSQGEFTRSNQNPNRSIRGKSSLIARFLRRWALLFYQSHTKARFADPGLLELFLLHGRRG